MAVISGWWPSVNGDRKYYIEQQAAVNAQIYSNGVLPVGEQFQVVSTGGFGVNVTAGYAWLNGYWILNDSDYVLTLDAPDGVLGRVDLIVLQWHRENRETAIVIKQGALASEPIAPELQRDADVYELCLAQIMVAAGVTAITQANITDTRTDSALCGLSSLYDPPSSDAWFAQFHASYKKWFDATNADYDAWFASLQTEFDVWYQSIKDLLSEETAVQLSERIEENAAAIRENAQSINDLIKLPAVTASDNGKFLRVVSGAWAAVAITDADGVSY